jgi:hypothetical protein
MRRIGAIDAVVACPVPSHPSSLTCFDQTPSTMKTLPIVRPVSGFARADLIAILASVTLLSVLLLGMGNTTRPSHRATACAAHLRSLSAALALYASDNSEYLPHPGWGNADSGGPDTWAYASLNLGRNPELPPRFPAANAIANENTEVVVQRGFQKLGQLWPYVGRHGTYRCPSDDPQTQNELRRFRGRPLKIISYAMNPNVLVPGDSIKTRRIHQFLGEDVAFQEIDDKDPFNFNDGSNSIGEGVCVRHWNGGYLGRMDGGVEFMTAAEYLKLIGNPKTRSRLWLTPRN